jgi:hypothetical protein
MRSFLALLILATAALSVPVASAQAGFFTQVVKGNIKNSVRRAKESAKDAALKGALVGLSAVCVAKAAAGRPCQ